MGRKPKTRLKSLPKTLSSGAPYLYPMPVHANPFYISMATTKQARSEKFLGTPTMLFLVMVHQITITILLLEVHHLHQRITSKLKTHFQHKCRVLFFLFYERCRVSLELG